MHMRIWIKLFGGKKAKANLIYFDSKINGVFTISCRKKINLNLPFDCCPSSSAVIGNCRFRKAYWDFLVGTSLGQESALKYFYFRSLQS